MNFQAYLSLPEGTATVAGLIAMMTDHYNILVRLEIEFCLQFSGTSDANDSYCLIKDLFDPGKKIHK